MILPVTLAHHTHQLNLTSEVKIMAAPKKPTHVVEHGKLYMAVNGKLQHVAKGTQLVLSADQANGLGARVALITSKTVVIDSGEAEDNGEQS